MCNTIFYKNIDIPVSYKYFLVWLGLKMFLNGFLIYTLRRYLHRKKSWILGFFIVAMPGILKNACTASQSSSSYTWYVSYKEYIRIAGRVDSISLRITSIKLRKLQTRVVTVNSVLRNNRHTYMNLFASTHYSGVFLRRIQTQIMFA